MAICLWSIIWSILTFLVVKGIENLSEAEEAEAQGDTKNTFYFYYSSPLAVNYVVIPGCTFFGFIHSFSPFFQWI